MERTLEADSHPGVVRRGVRFAATYLRIVGRCAYLLTLGPLFRGSRSILWKVDRDLERRYRQQAAQRHGVPRQIPCVSTESLAPDDVEVQLREPAVIDGNVSLFELLVIARLIRSREPRATFEIGTFDGRTTLNMAVNGKADSKVYTLDLPAAAEDAPALPLADADRKYIGRNRAARRFEGTEAASRITTLEGDSSTFDFGPYHGAMDLVFVDGSHSYEYVTNDTRAALRMLRPDGGIILWHDYGHPAWEGVTRALNELYASSPEFRSLRHIDGTTLVCLDTAAGSDRRME